VWLGKPSRFSSEAVALAPVRSSARMQNLMICRLCRGGKR
jgi:hypothetical protein